MIKRALIWLLHFFTRILSWLLPKPPKHLFIDVLKEYVDTYPVENDLTEETKGHYDVKYRNIQLFLASASLNKITIDDIRIKHVEELRLWLRNNLKSCSITHASRHVELCKAVAAFAVRREYTINNPLADISGRRDKPKAIIYCQPVEMLKMMAYKFQNAYLQLAADLFIFQCGTGVSYQDIYDHEITKRNGRDIIMGSRKAEVRYEAVMFQEAKDILDKYDGNLPLLSNQSYNKYIKEVAHILGIKKHLTTHVARKTHATLMTIRGVGTKPLSVQMGNTEKVLKDHYVGFSSEIMQNELKRLDIGNTLLVSG